MNEKQQNISELFKLLNTLTEEKNYIEILKGYCESRLETSDDLNKIYPIIEIIYKLHMKMCNQAGYFSP